MDVQHSAPLTDDQLAQQSDEALLLAYRSAGDQSAFAQLVSRYERELYNFLRRYLSDSTMAEDVFQATFLQIHLKGDQFEEGRKFRPWLYTIATNQAIDAQRRNRRHRIASLDGPGSQGSGEATGSLLGMLSTEDEDPAAQTEAEERRRWVLAALDELPETLRSAVHLVYFQGLKYREAADILSIPVGTVKSRLHSAIAKLSEAWAESDQSGAQ